MYSLSLLLLFFVLRAVVSNSFCENEDKVTLKCNYFPKDIPYNISRVRIQNFMKRNMKLDIIAAMFMTKNWRYVQYLELSDNSSSTKARSTKLNFVDGCFIDLKMLVELQIHITHFTLAADVFTGIASVKVLDMSGCVRLNPEELLQSLNETEKLPNLEQLTLSRINDYRLPNVFDIRWGQVLQQKNLVKLDISNTQMTRVDLGIIGYLKPLRNLNASGSFIDKIEHARFNASDMLNVQWLDLSYVVPPKSLRPIPGKLVILNKYLTNPRIPDVYTGLFTPKLVNISSVFSSRSSVWLINCTLVINKPLNYFHTREFIFKKNYIKYIDVTCINNSFTSFEIIDFSDNGLEFLSPFVSSCFPRIKTIHLSGNKLFTMAERNISLFEDLVRSFPHLQFVSLSGNILHTIPVNMFSNNFNLDTIDLSFNKLQQVTFTLQHLHMLKVLNLQNNIIKILDEISINHLDSIPCKTKLYNDIPVVILKSNKISCSSCDAKPFIRWLIETRLVNISLQDLTCIDGDNVHTCIDQHTVRRLQDMCNLVVYILISCFSAIIVVMVTVTSLHIIYKRRLRDLQLQHRYDVIQLLKRGNGHFKYACYLMFERDDITAIDQENLNNHVDGNTHDDGNNRVDGNNHDDPSNKNFIEKFVIGPLNESLRNEIGISEKHYVIYDEDGVNANRMSSQLESHYLDSAPVVIVFASEHFFDNYSNCFNLNAATADGKPILFMVCGDFAYGFKNKKEIKRILKNSKEIKWKIQNKKFIVQTPWEEISKSILDMIKIPPPGATENIDHDDGNTLFDGNCCDDGNNHDDGKNQVDGNNHDDDDNDSDVNNPVDGNDQ